MRTEQLGEEREHVPTDVPSVWGKPLNLSLTSSYTTRVTHANSGKTRVTLSRTSHVHSTRKSEALAEKSRILWRLDFLSRRFMRRVILVLRGLDSESDSHVQTFCNGCAYPMSDNDCAYKTAVPAVRADDCAQPTTALTQRLRQWGKTIHPSFLKNRRLKSVSRGFGNIFSCCQTGRESDADDNDRSTASGGGQ